MKKIMDWVMPAKNLAALVFAGLMCLYMVAGALMPVVRGARFNYTIPFVFVVQGLVLAVVAAAAWLGLLRNTTPHKWPYLPRLAAFSGLLVVALAACLLTFFLMPTDWAKLWLIVAAAVMAGVVALSAAGEAYFKSTGHRHPATA